MRVEDVMSRQVLTIESGDSCLEAVGRMHQSRVRHLPVVDGDGALVGVVTDRDLRHHLFSPGLYRELGKVGIDVLLKGVPVGQIMSRPVISVAPDADVMDAARRMADDRVGSLPVIEGRRVVGILTETDLLRHVCRADAACPAACADIIISYP